MTDSNVEAVHATFWIVFELFLRDDGVDSDGGLARLAVTNDELSLTTANRRHGIDCLDSGLEWFVNGFTLNDARRLDFDHTCLFRAEVTKSVDWVSECIEHAPHDLRANTGLDDFPSTLDFVTLVDALVGTEDSGADVVGFEVKNHAYDTTRELKEFACECIL